MTHPTFNLIDEPWLPVTRKDGRTEELGLLRLFTEAHELSTIDLETPDVLAGVYKMLLAIAHRAYDGPKDLKELKAIWKAGHFSSNKVRSYLEAWRSRFDLWDSKHPFLQDPKAAAALCSVSRLLVLRAKENNGTLFDHTTDNDIVELSFAEAARALVGAQHFALGGRIKGAKDSGVAHPAATAACILLTGTTVFETLCLNLCVYDGKLPIASGPKDAPCWEQDVAKAGRRKERGHLDLLTWRPRRYLLVRNEASGRVKGVVAAGEADRHEESEDFCNPMCAYRVSKSSGFLEVRIDPARAVWRESAALFTGNRADGIQPAPLRQAASLIASGVLGREARFNVLAAGFATDKAKVKLSRVERFLVPAALLGDAASLNTLRESLSLADEVEHCLGRAVFLGARRLLSAGERSPDTSDISALARSTGAEVSYWAALAAEFPHHLLALSESPEAARETWRTALRDAARLGFRQAEVKFANSPLGLRAVVDAQRALERDLAIHCPTSTEETHHVMA